MTDHAEAIAAARSTILAEADGLTALAAALDGPMGLAFGAACEILAAVTGRTIISGMGKSGHIARKIAATFASTGQPAYFVHPAEASHGDLGMITSADAVLALSRSGETAELTDLIHHCRRLGVPLIGLTFKAESALARMSTVALIMPDCGEADDDTPAPTTSTTMTLALGDALAVALLKERGFNAAAFSQFHPGGKLGALLKRVRDVMRDSAHAPLIAPDLAIPQTLAAMTEGGIGCVGVVDGQGVLIGIVTDGDLRRRLNPEMFAKTASALMTAAPKVVAPDAPLADAIALMNQARVTTLFVAQAGRPVGVVHMHDLLAAGVR
jgi:arabinose-5-phosphate isomerase